MRKKMVLISAVIALSITALAQEEQPLSTPTSELVNRLRSADWRTREAAQKKLLARGAQALDELEPALEDENFEIRYRARLVFESVGARARAMKLLGYLVGEEEAGKALDEIQKKVKQPLRRLTSPKPAVRAALVRELAGCGLGGALPLVVHLLGDKDHGVQNEALRALQSIENEARTEILLKAIEKGTLLLKCRALLALGRLQEKDAIDKIAGYLESKTLYLRLAAVESLDFMRDEKAGKHLVKAFKDKYERVRWNAADAFTRVYCKEAISPLIDALEARTAKLMSEEELKELTRVLVPAGFNILTGEAARLKPYALKALQYQSGSNYSGEGVTEKTVESWRQWWKKNKDTWDKYKKTKEQIPAGK